MNRGVLFQDLNRKEKALSDYNKSIELNSQYAAPYSNRGALFCLLNRKTEALKDFNIAIELDPQFAAPWHGKGQLFLEDRTLLESQRYQWAQPCFARALILGGLQPNFLKSYLKTYQLYPKHPYFLQSILKLLPPARLRTIGLVRKQVAETCQYINLYLAYLKTRDSFLKMPTTQQLQLEALINYFMGDAHQAFQLLKTVLKKNPYNLQAHYYLIKCCADFFEDEEPYIEKAIIIAEKVYQTLDNTKENITTLEANQRYYLALIFALDTEYDTAINCIQSVWNKVDFLPLRYLYYHLLFASIQESKEQERRQTALNAVALQKQALTDKEYDEKKDQILRADYWTTEDTYQLLLQAPFPTIGQGILAIETTSNRQKYFAHGFPIHYLDPKRKEWWAPIYHYAHYEEIANAITLFQLQASKHFNQQTFVPGHSLPEFWDSFKIEGTDIVIMQEAIRKHKREKYGLAFLKSAETYMKEEAATINSNKADLKKAIDYVLYETGKTKENTKQAFEDLEAMPAKTKKALVNRIASKIEAKELEGDIAAYRYLIAYFYLCENLSERDSILLQFYAIYAQAFRKKELSKVIQGGLKDQFKANFGAAYDQVTLVTTAMNPVIGLTLSALKPLAKGTMGELFVNLLKHTKHTTLMRYSTATYDTGAYEKVLLAPSFQQAFLEFVGAEKERLGDKFEEVYPLYGFEEWVR